MTRYSSKAVLFTKLFRTWAYCGLLLHHICGLLLHHICYTTYAYWACRHIEATLLFYHLWKLTISTCRYLVHTKWALIFILHSSLFKETFLVLISETLLESSHSACADHKKALERSKGMELFGAQSICFNAIQRFPMIAFMCCHAKGSTRVMLDVLWCVRSRHLRAFWCLEPRTVPNRSRASSCQNTMYVIARRSRDLAL